MGEVKDPYRGLKKLKKKLSKREPEMFEKGEVGILTGSGKKKRKKK